MQAVCCITLLLPANATDIQPTELCVHMPQRHQLCCLLCMSLQHVQIRWCAQVVLPFMHVQPKSCCGALVAGSVKAQQPALMLDCQCLVANGVVWHKVSCCCATVGP